MIDKPSEEWTEDDWRELRARAFELAGRVLDLLQDQEDDEYSPQVAGFALIIAMGRLAGQAAYRHIGVEDVWKLWTDANAKNEFQHAFEFERRSEN